MEKLTPQQQESIKKMGSARLIVKLLEVGWSEEKVEELDRTGLIKAWAEIVAAGKEKPVAVAAGAVVSRNDRRPNFIP
jgi:hypothetical protein